MNYNTFYTALADYPHIQKKLDIFWGTEQCRPFLMDLLVTDRIGRKGFPFAVLSTIQDLIQLHDQLYPGHCRPVIDGIPINDSRT